MQDKTTHSAHCHQRAFFERNKFYFGKLLTVSDFTDEQSYINEKRWMINRLGLGWGVLCGLKVRPHDCDKNKVIVEPGVAIDPFGHEIVVCREETVDLNTAQDECPPEKSSFYYLSIKYEECGVKPSPIPIEDCDGHKTECVFNRTREGYRFVVTREKPDFNTHLRSDLRHALKCETECHRFMQNPSPVISNCCPERPECEAVPLARVCYNPTTETTAMDIDISPANRKLAFSNEILYDLISCLQQEISHGRAAHHDRRQHVPLLASTIRGLSFQDGKNTKLDRSKGYEGKHPFRLTTDGDYIWITDRDDDQIWRIDRRTNRPINDPKLRLDNPAWGIAYDGLHMWVTHHAAFRGQAGAEYGKLTRINVCTLERWTIDRLLKCDTLPDCYKFPESAGATGADKIRPYPGEIVLHAGDIYVAHDWKNESDHAEYQQQQEGQQFRPRPHPGGKDEGYHLSLTRIDPVKGCIVEIIEIPEPADYEALSRIRAMASDGDALWITYQISSKERRGNKTAILRKITKDSNGKSIVGAPIELNGELPERMVFDGTRLWVSHDDGVSIIDTETNEEERVDTKTAHNALAYGGGALLWAAVPGKNEAFISLIDIFTEEEVQRLELLELDSQSKMTIEMSDMQFDGVYIYLAYHLEDNNVKKGVIHRLLP